MLVTDSQRWFISEEGMTWWKRNEKEVFQPKRSSWHWFWSRKIMFFWFLHSILSSGCQLPTLQTPGRGVVLLVITQLQTLLSFSIPAACFFFSNLICSFWYLYMSQLGDLWFLNQVSYVYFSLCKKYLASQQKFFLCSLTLNLQTYLWFTLKEWNMNYTSNCS